LFFVPPIKISGYAPARNHRKIKHNLLIYPTLNNEQASLRGIGFCSLHRLLCFAYGVYSEMRINLQMIKTIHLIFFNSMSLPYSHHPSRTFYLARPQFTNPGSVAGFLNPSPVKYPRFIKQSTRIPKLDGEAVDFTLLHHNNSRSGKIYTEF